MTRLRGCADKVRYMGAWWVARRALNMLGGVLEAKRANENHLLASPLAPSSTIVRPGVFAAGMQPQ